MASNINANNIDGAYPVAGQDNDSQGFRDNFTNTRTNFQFAADEITDLQNKVILKAPLTSGVANLQITNNMAGSPLIDFQAQDVSYTFFNLGTVTGSPQTIDYSVAPFQQLTTGGSVGIAFSNFPINGIAGVVTVAFVITNIAHTVTLPAAVGAGNSLASARNIIGLNLSTGVITFNQTGTYVFEFRTNDGGASVYIQDLVRPANSYLGSDTFAANGSISLNTSTTVITSSANLVGTLSAGTQGQVKVLAYGNTSVGNARITVTNSAWGGSNIANLSVVGSAATFQYVGNTWYCTGNNGVTFS